jgi:quinol monooxygenase YgiN
MYGLIGKIKAAAGQREALITILVQASAELPDCLSYIVAQDAADPNALWVTEVWESAESHRASLALPAAQHALAQGRPLIASLGERFETVPVGGPGIAQR